MLLHGIICDRPLRRLRPSAPIDIYINDGKRITSQCIDNHSTAHDTLHAMMHTALPLQVNSAQQGFCFNQGCVVSTC